MVIASDNNRCLQVTQALDASQRIGVLGDVHGVVVNAELIERGTLVNVFWDAKDAVVMHTKGDNMYDVIENAVLGEEPGGAAQHE